MSNYFTVYPLADAAWYDWAALVALVLIGGLVIVLNFVLRD